MSEEVVEGALADTAVIRLRRLGSRQRAWLAALVLVSTSGLGGVPFGLAAREGPPNFILILADNLGYGDLGCYGSSVHRTPRIDAMAREGMRFTHFYSSSGVCTPSRASLMTGCYAQRVGMHDNPRDGWVLRPVSPYGLAPEEVTVAEVLARVGYASTCIGKWHLGDQAPFLPTRQGFDEFFGIPYSDDMTGRIWRDPSDAVVKWPPLPLMQDEVVIEAPVERAGLTQRYTERALDFIRRHRERPFFLFLSHATPGSTASPHVGEAFAGRSANGPWGDAVEELDASTGAILDLLRELNLAEDTLVVWTSDNGAPNNPGDLRRGSNHPLFGRGYSTAEGGMRVPMIAWWPGTVPPGRECTELSTMMDLLPTFAELGGTAPPEDRTIDGLSIRPLLVGEDGGRTPHKAFFYYAQQQLQAVRSGPWKLYLSLEVPRRHPHHRGAGPTRPLLVNVEVDPGETVEMASQHPEVVLLLQGMAEAARAELGDHGVPGSGQRPVGQVQSPSAQILPD